MAPKRPPGGSREAPRRPKGLRMSPRRRQAFEKAPENRGRRPASVRSARARAPRESSLQHRGVIGEPRKTASNPSHSPPPGPESSLHHCGASRKTQQVPKHTVAAIVFADSAFRFLSRQVLGPGNLETSDFGPGGPDISEFEPSPLSEIFDFSSGHLRF